MHSTHRSIFIRISDSTMTIIRWRFFFSSTFRMTLDRKTRVSTFYVKDQVKSINDEVNESTNTFKLHVATILWPLRGIFFTGFCWISIFSHHQMMFFFSSNIFFFELRTRANEMVYACNKIFSCTFFRFFFFVSSCLIWKHQYQHHVYSCTFYTIISKHRNWIEIHEKRTQTNE